MERRYTKDKINPRWRYESPLRRGLKKVNIGSNVWLIGRDSIVDGRKHQVIYGPGRREYHLWDKDVDFVNLTMKEDYYGDRELRKSYCNRDGNTSIEHRVKVYILTNILDSKDNWCFDLKLTPSIGSRVKVIYSNGTVKWVESFSGKFEDAELISKRSTFGDEIVYTSMKFVSPLGYRKW